MSVFRFESEEALRFSITSGLVPNAVLERAARVWRDGDAIVVAPEGSFPAEASKALVAAGVKRLPNSATSEAARDVASWVELVPLVRSDADFDPESSVLFFVPEGASLVDLAGELLRLGCDRLEYRALAAGAGHLLRANAPPYYSVLRTLDAGAAIEAYVAEPPGQERVWVAIGYEHPLLRFLRSESTVLVAPKGWRTIPDAPWSDIYALVDVELPAAKSRRVAAPEPPRIKVPLRLARAATLDAPSLWVIREDAANKVERLVASLPEEMLRALLFAALPGKGGLTVVIRLRPGRTTSLEIDGEAYRAHPSIANLFLPVSATLEPPLRRDRLRDLLTPDPDELVWLRAKDKNGFKVESAADAAFQPITEWVEYVIDDDREKWLPWVRSATFDFQSYVGAAPQARRKVDEDPSTPEPAPPPQRREESQPAPEPRRPRPAAAAAPQPAPAAPLRAAVVDTSRVAEELAKVEQTFFSLDAGPDDPERMKLWARMAVLDTMLKRTNDAALCWARVIWENPEDATARGAWSEAEQAAPTATLLTLVDPSRDHVRAVAARLVAGEPSLTPLGHDISRWLDKHDGALDVRASWLARRALAQMVGGDRLGLARARDRLLGRIHSGLSLERDVPSFLRRAGRSRDVAQIELLARRLDRLVDAFDVKERRRTATEADPKLTGAYVRFVVAFGLARLGRIERARQIRDEAVAALPPSDPIHAVLVRAYVARIGHALEGLPPETPLPAEISALINGLQKLERYKVDRVRQASKVLEPHERLDPIAAFQRGEADPRGPEFAPLRAEADPAKIDALVADIVASGVKADPASKARLFDGAMDFFPSLRQERAHAHLATILKNVDDILPPRRVQVLDEALMLAGHFGEESLARQILAILEPLVAKVGVEGAAAIAPVASGMLRTLRRFGLRDEAERMLAVFQDAAKGPGTPALIARLHIAAALSFLGKPERALPVFDEAFKALPEITAMPERLQLGRALAKALGAAPIEYALAGLEKLEAGVTHVTDSFNTNTHVCLSVLDFMEALVLGYASDDLAIDPEARRHLDDDEYLVRRRIHRDTTE